MGTFAVRGGGGGGDGGGDKYQEHIVSSFIERISERKFGSYSHLRERNF